MKKLLFLTISLFFATAYLFAQSVGTNPALIMNRYNSSPTISPLPVLQGDLLGTIKWNGLTDYGAICTGVAIRSFITDPVAPNVLQANMIFQTSDLGGLTNRMIITENGLVGIGLDNPAPNFRLDVLGNTHTSGNFYGRIHFDANVGNNDAPNQYTDEAYFELKNRTALSSPLVPVPDNIPEGVNAQGGLLSLAPGGTSLDHQLFFGDAGIFTRRKAGSAGDWSNATWYKLLTGEEITGTAGRVARFTGTTGTVSHTLGNSQLFDDGTRVGIRNFAPNAGTDIDITGATRINGNLSLGTLPTANRLEVLGNSRLNGDANVTGNLDVDVNANVDGNLQVDGNGRVDGRLIVGNPTTALGSHELYVNGSAIAEEVVVKLQPNWPDYVFEKDYDLAPLSEVEKYVQENKRLPGVASAKEIAENGLELGQTQKVQMEKIEELYLHMIALEKELREIKAENAAMKAQIEQLEKRN